MLEPQTVEWTTGRFHAFLSEDWRKSSLTDMNALSNANTLRGGIKSPHIGLTSNVSPKAQSLESGVSVDYVIDAKKKWYVLRVSYGRVQAAYSLLKNASIDYYLPLHHVVKVVNNKKTRTISPLLPNFIFAYTDSESAHALIDKGVGCVSYYYNHFKVNEYGKNPPLTIDDKSMKNFISVTSIDNEHIRVVDPQACHYKNGGRVKIVAGRFAGVEGRVARIAGQQRVVVQLEGLCLVATAYIPTAFIQPIDII